MNLSVSSCVTYSLGFATVQSLIMLFFRMTFGVQVCTRYLSSKGLTYYKAFSMKLLFSSVELRDNKKIRCSRHFKKSS